MSKFLSRFVQVAATWLRQWVSSGSAAPVRQTGEPTMGAFGLMAGGADLTTRR